MKKLYSNLFYVSFIIAALIFTGCQEEFEEIGGNEEDTIEAGSTTASLIMNTSSNDGSYDNIVDESSCIAIQFPYTVEIAGIEINIDSIEDLRLIEEIFDEFDDDLDILEIVFPITIILSDFTEVKIENKEALRELVAECREGGDDDDIECIDFVYPITMFTFDVNQQVTDEVAVNSDREMRKFFKDRDPGELVSIGFPITLIKYDGTEIQVNSNAELARILEMAKDECDEDDDNDYNDDDFEEDRFVGYLTECPWELRDIRRLGVDQTGQYLELIFEFNEEGIVEVTGPLGNTTTGAWSFEFTHRGPKIEMEFEEYVDFNLTWFVYEIKEGRIKFYSDNDNRIIMKRKCDGFNKCNVEAVAGSLEHCLWRIVEATEDYNYEVVIDFSNKNIHAYSENNGTVVDEGNWEVTETGLRFNALFAEVAGMIGDWKIVDCGEGRIKLMNDEGRYYILEKDCGFVIPGPDALRELLAECEWIIKKVVAQGTEMDRLLGYEFQFLSTDVITLSNGTTTLEGVWQIGYNNENVLSLMISIMDEPDLSFEWPVAELRQDRLKFETIDIGYELLLQRVCGDNANDADVLETRNIMMGGAWNVAFYKEGEVDSTATFTGYDFYFGDNHLVKVDENDNPIIEGLWRVLRGHDHHLRYYLNFANDEVFGELTEDWKIVEVSANRIELKVVIDANVYKTLVFEKQ